MATSKKTKTIAVDIEPELYEQVVKHTDEIGLKMIAPWLRTLILKELKRASKESDRSK